MRISHTGRSGWRCFLIDPDREKIRCSINRVDLKPEWKQLFQAFPERFTIGSDIDAGRWPYYDQTITRLRTLILGNLDRKTAEEIAFKNAWKLTTHEEWQD